MCLVVDKRQKLDLVESNSLVPLTLAHAAHILVFWEVKRAVFFAHTTCSQNMSLRRADSCRAAISIDTCSHCLQFSADFFVTFLVEKMCVSLRGMSYS